MEENQLQEQLLPETPDSFLRRMPPIPFAILSLSLVFFTYQIVGGIITFFLFSAKVNEENVQLVRWSTLVGQLLLILVPTVLLARARHGDSKSFFRIKFPDAQLVLLSWVGVFALQQVLQGYMMLQDWIPLPADVQEFVRQIKNLFEEMYKILITAHSPAEFIFVVLVVALTPAICEEMLFRGLIQRNLEGASTGFRAAVIGGVIFGLYHLNPFSFVALAVLGIYFGFLVYRSNNLSIAIFAHFFNNFVACLAVYLHLNDDFIAIAPGGEPSSAQLFVNYSGFGLVFLVATYYFVKGTKPTLASEG